MSRHPPDMAAVTGGELKVKALLTGEADGERGQKKQTSCGCTPAQSIP